jgi:hypothetical protein
LELIIASNIITQERLKELLHYNPDTGIFTHIPKKRNTRKTLIAGFNSKEGYLCIGLNRKYYKLHRLAWLYVYGELPERHIDHINGIRHDNRICNLRQASSSDNAQNICKYSNNTSGYIGVSYHKNNQKYVAQISINGKNRYLGIYETAELAYEVYLKAKLELHTFNPVPRYLQTTVLQAESAHFLSSL